MLFEYSYGNDAAPSMPDLCRPAVAQPLRDSGGRAPHAQRNYANHGKTVDRGSRLWYERCDLTNSELT